MNTVEIDLSAITTAASGVHPNIDSANMGTRITVMDNVLGTVQTSLDGMKVTIENVSSKLSDNDSYNKNYSFALYGTTMALALLSLIGVIFIKCFNLIVCRYFLWLVCFVSFFVAVILFLLAILLSISMSISYYSCNYFSNTFTSPN